MARGAEHIRWAVEDVRGRKFAIACMSHRAFQDPKISWPVLDAQISQSGYELRIIFPQDLPRSMVAQAEVFMVHINGIVDPQIYIKCVSILKKHRILLLNDLVTELVEWSGQPANKIYSSLYCMLARNEIHANPSTSPPICQIGLPGAPGCFTPLVLGRRPANINVEVELLGKEEREPCLPPRYVRQFLNSKRGQRYRKLFSIFPDPIKCLTRHQAASLGSTCNLSISSVYRFRQCCLDAGGSTATFESIALFLVSRRNTIKSDRLKSGVKEVIHNTINDGYLIRAGEGARISTITELTHVIGRQCLLENLPIPCRKTVVRHLAHIEAQDPLRFAKLRHGVNTQDKLRPRQGGLNTQLTGALLAVDCSPCDVISNLESGKFYVQPRHKVKVENAKRGWMIVVKDIGAGVLLDVSIVERKPRASDILCSLQAVFLNLSESHKDAGVEHSPIGRGLPQRLRLDGGSEFVNSAVGQIMETLGIELLPRKSWNRHHGGHEERAIQILTFAQHALEGTTLNRFYLKEPYGKIFISSLTLSDLRRFSLRVMEAYNLQASPTFPVSRLDMEKNLHDIGLCAWRPLSNEQRHYVEERMFPIKTACCQNEGIFMLNTRYNSDEINDLISGKRKVDVFYDPNDIRKVWLLHPDNEKLILLTAKWPVWFSPEGKVTLDLWLRIDKRVKDSRKNLRQKTSTAYEISLDIMKEIRNQQLQVHNFSSDIEAESPPIDFSNMSEAFYFKPADG